MKKEFKLWQSLVSCALIIAMLFCSPIEAVAQASSVSRSDLLEYGTELVLRVDEEFKFDSKAENGSIRASVDADVYSADGSKVVIKAGTPAFIEFSSEKNGAWGKPGKVCMTYATTKTTDNKRIALRLSSCKKGGSTIGGVIALSVVFFPFGMLSGFMKGSMPKIPSGSTFVASVMQDVAVE